MLLLRQAAQRLFTAGTGCIQNQQPSLLVNSIQVRTKVRYHLPRPTEVKRVRKQGFLSRLQTVNSRRQLMEKILRGDKVIAH